MLPRDEAAEAPKAFTAERTPTVTDDGTRIWRVYFKGEFVGWTRRPGTEIDELNAKHEAATRRKR
jgi:hypothetical protein